MSKLTFAEFSKANEARKKQFFRDASEMWSISDAFMTAAGEMGEVAEALLFLAAMRHLGEAGNTLKKVRRAELGMLNKNADDRQIDNMTQAKAKVAGEIGGFMCYLDQLCVQIGLRLEDCIVDEFNTKSKELDLPERIVDGVFLLATRGTFKMGPEGHLQEFEGEIYREPEEEEPVTISMRLDEDGDLYRHLAADIERTKYRGSFAETQARHVGKHPGLGMPYGEQPFNERGIVGRPCALKECPHPEICDKEDRCCSSGPRLPGERVKGFGNTPANEVYGQAGSEIRTGDLLTLDKDGRYVPINTVRSLADKEAPSSVPTLKVPFLSTDRTFRSADFYRVERIEIGPEIYNFDEPILLSSGVEYELGVNHGGQPFCRPIKSAARASAEALHEAHVLSQKPDRPTVWHDGCAKCRFCCCELDGDPYCVEPSIKAQHPMGLGINRAVNDYCAKDGKLSLFEPRK